MKKGPESVYNKWNISVCLHVWLQKLSNSQYNQIVGYHLLLHQEIPQVYMDDPGDHRIEIVNKFRFEFHYSWKITDTHESKFIYSTVNFITGIGDRGKNSKLFFFSFHKSAKAIYCTS